MFKKLFELLKSRINCNIKGAEVNAKIADTVQTAREISNNHSTVNNQLTINNGLTYKDATEIFAYLLQQNFPKLQQEAWLVAEQRVAEFQKKFFNKIAPILTDDILQKFKEPDIQYYCNNIARIAALRNNPQINDILMKALIEKLNSNTDFDSVELSQIIKIIENISPEELKILGLYYLIVYEKINDTSSAILSELLNFDTQRCFDYRSQMFAQSIAYQQGGFSSYNYLQTKEEGNNIEFIKQINNLFIQNGAFCNFVVNKCGIKIAEKYLQTFSATVQISG